MRRCDIDKSSYFWTTTCGTCHPGGGPAEYDRKGNRYDEFVRDPENNIIPRGDNYLDGDYYRSNWGKSGVLEADCLICHLKGYNWKKRALAVRGGFLYEAPMVGAGWFKDLKVSKPAVPSAKPKAISFRTDYTQTNIADPANLAAFITGEVPDKNCWNCHIMPESIKRGRSWEPETDVHKAKGLTCTYCHPSGENHEIAKGDVLAGSVRDDLDGTMKGCIDCHLKGADDRAPKPDHKFPDLHIEKITCGACHIPYKTNAATSVIDNATTGHSIKYLTTDFLSNDPLNPNRSCQRAPKNSWCPGFVKYKGKIRPVDPMQAIWWGDWDRASHRVIPVPLWRIRDFTGANAKNKFSITNFALLDALKGSKAVNTAEEIKTYLNALSEGKDRFGCRIVYHSPVLVKGGMIYYLENNQLNKAMMPTKDGGFKCCEAFDLSHNVVSGKLALGATGCKECHQKPSPFFNRKILIDPFNRDGRPVYKEAWEILGYSKKKMQKLTKDHSNNVTP
jgi:hypothetical protein